MSVALLTPLVLTLGMLAVIVTDLWRASPERTYRLSLLTLALAVICSFWNMTQAPGQIWLFLTDVLVFDTMSAVFTSIAVFLAFLCVGISWASFSEEQASSGEYYSLMMASTLGAILVVHAKELLTFFIAFELLSIPLYILVGFRRYHRKSAEAGLKYFLSGALSSAIFLFGASWIYGGSGSTNYDAIANGIGQHSQPVLLGLLMVMAAYAFKLSAAPFHMWAPDTYEGAPLPVAAFLSSVPKVVMLGAAIRLFSSTSAILEYETMVLLSTLSVLSVALGNLVAITQKEVTRMAAYSGVAQVGYLLIGLSALLGALGGSRFELAGEALGALLFYLTVYTVTNIAFWLVLVTVGKARGSTHLDAFNGLAQSSPPLALALLVALFSLAGVPPLAGFVGKLYLFRAAFYTQPLMAFFGVFGSVVSLVYYFGVLRRCYFLEPPADATPIELSKSSQGLLWALLGLTIVGGLYPGFAQTCMRVAERMITP